jgi:hypothetical protein
LPSHSEWIAVSSIAAEFADVLGTVSRPNAFCVAGTEQILAPGLAVEGVGSIALPLLPVQAEQLIAIAERAPYGRGEDTLTDVTVRRTWQIAPDRVRIAGKHWPQTIQAVVARVAEGLGVADPVEAELYKLLVYDTGSFFVPHRDTEKVPGLFATIVLALPSVSTGGDLIARHRGRDARSRRTSPSPRSTRTACTRCSRSPQATGWCWCTTWCVAAADVCRGCRTIPMSRRP